jgi:hypothetical protein
MSAFQKTLYLPSPNRAPPAIFIHSGKPRREKRKNDDERVLEMENLLPSQPFSLVTST